MEFEGLKIYSRYRQRVQIGSIFFFSIRSKIFLFQPQQNIIYVEQHFIEAQMVAKYGFRGKEMRQRLRPPGIARTFMVTTPSPRS